MATINGILNLHQLNDSDMGKVYEFKAAHEGKFTLSQQQTQYNPNQSSLIIRWDTPKAFDLLNSLVKELLKQGHPG